MLSSKDDRKIFYKSGPQMGKVIKQEYVFVTYNKTRNYRK